MRSAFLGCLFWATGLAIAGAAMEPIEEARVFRYNGSGNALDQGSAIATFADGGAVVAGASRGANQALDMLVIRLNDEGQRSELWPDVGFGPGVRRYDGKINQDDRATDVAVAPDGSVYVTGYSRSLNTFDDYIVLKFDPSGVLCGTWPDTGAGVGVRRYTRLGGYDQATALAIAEDDGVFVTGWSSGVTAPSAIATLRYSAQGVLLWSAVYQGTTTGQNQGLALIPTDDGGVVVGGNSTRANGRSAYVLLRYTDGGSLSSVWPSLGDGVGVRVFAGQSGETAELAAIASLPDGGIVATGRTDAGGGDFATSTVAWLASGNHLWTTRHRAGTVASDQGAAVEVTPEGNVLVASRSSRKGLASEIEVNQYASDGTFSEIWPDTGEGSGIRRWGGVQGLGAFPVALALDRLGNVFVAGRSLTGGGRSDMVVLKYGWDGQFLWQSAYNGPGNNLDEAAALAIGTDDSILVVGRSDGVGTGADLVYLSWPQELPILWTSPATKLANSGEPLAFSVEAVGRAGAELTYQWFQDENLVGSGETFTPGMFSSVLAGNYELRVTDGFNTVRSMFFVAGMGIHLREGNPLLEVHGAEGRSFLIHSSADLMDWSEWQSFVHPGGTVEVAVPGGQRTFFRLALPTGSAL